MYLHVLLLSSTNHSCAWQKCLFINSSVSYQAWSSVSLRQTNIKYQAKGKQYSKAGGSGTFGF